LKAIVIHSYGGPEVLSYEEVPDPRPKPAEIVVQVHAVSIQRLLDIEVRRGSQGQRGITLPLVPGVDPSGVVVEVGNKVIGFRPGDRVAISHHVACGDCAACQADDPANCSNPRMLGIHRWGGDAQYVRVPYPSAFKIPDGLSFAEATVISRHAATAYKLLVHVAKLRPTESVLIMGASGNLGSLGIQIAKHMVGATVFAAAGSAARAQAGVELGADVGIDYGSRDLTEEVMRLTNGRGVDVLYDNIANPDVLPKAMASLTHGGRMVTAGAHAGPVVPVNFRLVYGRHLTIMGSSGYEPEDYAACFEAAAEGKLKARYECIMPLSETAAAHRLIESDPGVGKIILDPTLDGGSR
jgi:NADPH:quinone reductase